MEGTGVVVSQRTYNLLMFTSLSTEGVRFGGRNEEDEGVSFNVFVLY